jgi:beta-mannanase
MNQYILMSPIKTPETIPFHIQKEITDYNEMSDKIVDIDIDMNVLNLTRNVSVLISFRPFHGRSNSTIYI